MSSALDDTTLRACRKSTRASSATLHVKTARTSRLRSAKPAGSTRRDAWITDPHALLSALERATSERTKQIAPVEEMRHIALLEAPLEPEPFPPRPLVVLRDDERIGHASSEGIVVIIRRRRAA
jgi:hypothetical protein